MKAFFCNDHYKEILTAKRKRVKKGHCLLSCFGVVFLWSAMDPDQLGSVYRK